MTESEALAELASALLECTAPIALTIDLMAHAPDGLPAPDALRAVVREELAPLDTVLAGHDLRTATAVLQAATPLLVEHLLRLHPRPRLQPRRPQRARRPC